MINIIVATDKKGGIGKNNQLLWHLPEDLKRFRQMTGIHPIIMGRKTYESIGRPLPNRKNVVITRDENLALEGCIMASSLTEALQMFANEDVFIIGGGKVYAQAMDISDRIYLTLVDTELEADTFFPTIEEGKWEITHHEKHSKDVKHDYDYEFIDYKRVQ